MSEEILIALMKLFALASDTSDITNESRSIIKHSLKTELNKAQIEKFLAIYDSYLEKYQSGKGSYEDVLNPKHVKEICHDINASLSRTQKYIVLFRLLEYIFVDGKISKYEKVFVKLLSDIFNISERDFNDVLDFTKANSTSFPDNEHILIVSKEEFKNLQKTKHISDANFNGYLIILEVKDINLYMFRYIGDSALFLNGLSIVPERAYIFNNGAALRGNKMTPVYFSDILATFLEKSSPEKLIFEANCVGYHFDSGDIGLHEFSFKERNGRMVGVMGGSGSGKSTMLNVLNGNYTPTSGNVTINGFDIHTEKDKVNGVIGFVTQDDLLIEELTVFQNLYYSAKLCFSDLQEIQITEKVHLLLKSLGLYNAKDLKVGNPLEKVISGGQRKRLNIALELIRQPSVLFVDEPTSGLSSRDSENVMDLLKELALKGKLIFVVIHQPSSYIFKLFDRLILLDNGGYTIYYGEPVDSVSYFKSAARHLDADESECVRCGNVNSELIFDIVDQKTVNEYGKRTSTRRVRPDEWHKKFKKYQSNNPPLKTAIASSTKLKNTLNTPNKIKQFFIFLSRDLKAKSTNKQYLIINLLEAPVLAVFMAYFVRYTVWGRDGQVTYSFFNNENIPAYMFMTVVVALFIGMTVSAEEIFKDRMLQKREKFLNLSKASYLSSKFFILLCISAFQTFLFIIIGNSILGIEEMTMRYWLIMFSTSYFANMIGLNLSASFNSAVTIYILIPFMIIPQLIFSGVIVNFDRLNPSVSSRSVVPFIGEVMASRWAYEALMVTQFKDNELEKQLYPIDQKLSHINYLKTYWITELEAEVHFIKLNFESKNQLEKTNRFAATIQNEISKPQVDIDFPAFKFSTDLVVENITMKRLNKISGYLTAYKDYLNKQFLLETKQRDKAIYQIEKQYDDPNIFNQLKNRYTNESVNNMVHLTTKMNKVIVIDHKMIPIIDPIFREAKGVRSHFYAPKKLLFGYQMDTFWYNIMILWLMSLSLMTTLYFDIFKRFIASFENKKFKRV